MKTSVTVKKINIPTYEVGAAEKLPIFSDKRVYQGSSGKVYPHPVTEHVSDEKKNREYEAIFLENEYLLVMILPELGGRIQRILDKTNTYDAVYYNEVIKPALVGLAGPWISGGIEFNWPQHHRPSTFDPVSYEIEEHEDGSSTVWVGEIEKMFHTKGMAGFTLYPDKAYLEIKGKLYNPTSRPQTFLWWANPAVSVNETTQSIFPPDVNAVMDHGKRDVSTFPIATGTYYKVDYSKGVDISKYINIPVPTSYMAYHSEYDFVGNFDYGKNAGVLHIADHHISPGKKQWTWGCGDFGRAWDRNLTDENGPYIELMAGVFTDNQPDFTYIAPYEEKEFTQYFMPYKTVGAVKCATIEAAINLEVSEGVAEVKVYTPYEHQVKVILKGSHETYLNENMTLSPVKAYVTKVSLKDDNEKTLVLKICDELGNTLCEYAPSQNKKMEMPEPAQPAKRPGEIESLEELYLTAMHLEQYRHATYSPEDYYLEGLHRDETDSRLNNGYGKYLFNKGEFKKSQGYFEKAIKKLTWKNPNPYDMEPYYNLGLALEAQGMYEAAYDAFYKAIWSSNLQDKGFYHLACLCSKKKEYKKALEFVEQSLLRGAHNYKARHLKTALLRLLGKEEEASHFALNTRKIDPLDFCSAYEMYLLSHDENTLNTFKHLMRNDVQNVIEVASSYLEFGMNEDAKAVLSLSINKQWPMHGYYLAYSLRGNESLSKEVLEQTEKLDSSYCFPNSLMDELVLEYAILMNPEDDLALYLVGNLLYDKGRYEEAIASWERAKAINPDHYIVRRNLAHGYFNKCQKPHEAYEEMKAAYHLAPQDPRLFYEYDCLKKQLNVPVSERLKAYEENSELIQKRDDLYTEYVTLLNSQGEYKRALTKTMVHKFHPWEGGEGKIAAQYKVAQMGIAKAYSEKGERSEAKAHLKAALTYPENLGEGKLIGTLDNDIYYELGCLSKGEEAEQDYILATRGDSGLSAAMYYNDQPPEMLYYRGLAEEKLGHDEAAKEKFSKLVSYGMSHKKDQIVIDYFAVSLPDFLMFETDLTKKNEVNCCYLMALGYLGLGEKEKALSLAKEGLEKEEAHQGLKLLISSLNR